jgi:replication factor C subunit 1
MDEIDGIGGHSDRGGIGAVVNLIKNTLVPIVCICNDKSDRRLQALMGLCLDLKF